MFYFMSWELDRLFLGSYLSFYKYIQFMGATCSYFMMKRSFINNKLVSQNMVNKAEEAA